MESEHGLACWGAATRQGPKPAHDSLEHDAIAPVGGEAHIARDRPQLAGAVTDDSHSIARVRSGAS